MLAARILAAEKLVMADGSVQDHVIFEVPTHLSGEFGYCKCAAFGFAGSGRFEDDLPVRSDYDLILTARARLFGAAFKSLSLRFRFIELGFSPGLGTMNSGLYSHGSY